VDSFTFISGNEPYGTGAAHQIPRRKDSVLLLGTGARHVPLKFAKKRNLDGLNQLVVKGKCDFVPDGEIVRLENYRINSIGNTKVVELELEEQSV
jgi:hypothetical protein